MALMVLLMVLAEALANPRLSLMLAINQLQTEFGPDRRISAPAGILDRGAGSPEADGVAQPHFTGVWNAAESPFAKWTLDKPSYDKEGFRRWLVSGEPDDTKRIDFAKSGAPSGDKSRTAVSAEANSGRLVEVPVISGERASFAWWTSDDGTKAVLAPRRRAGFLVQVPSPRRRTAREWKRSFRTR
jgi:hypothetical protein